MKDSDGNRPNGVVYFISNEPLENHPRIRRMTTTTTTMIILVVVVMAAVGMPRLGDQWHEKRRVVVMPTQRHPKKMTLFQMFLIINAFMPRHRKKRETFRDKLKRNPIEHVLVTNDDQT
jgi:hypothetical protein